MEPFPARIHVLLAREASVGVVIRRGPSKHVCTMLWDRDKDEFKLGQWLKGRIYEHRSDLSADGRHFIYFAMNGKWTSESMGSWTAISRAPYLKALTIFPQGYYWGGGGVFTRRDWLGKNLYWLNGGGMEPLRTSSEVQEDNSILSLLSANKYAGVYYPRLLRDGWTLVEKQQEARTFERPIGQGWVLRKISRSQSKRNPGKGFHWDEHELARPNGGKLIHYPDWEWADIDRDRLVWAEGGCLFAGKMDRNGITEQKRLFDFNDMVFEPIKAPY